MNRRSLLTLLPIPFLAKRLPETTEPAFYGRVRCGEMNAAQRETSRLIANPPGGAYEDVVGPDGRITVLRDDSQ